MIHTIRSTLYAVRTDMRGEGCTVQSMSECTATAWPTSRCAADIAGAAYPVASSAKQTELSQSFEQCLRGCRLDRIDRVMQYESCGGRENIGRMAGARHGEHGLSESTRKVLTHPTARVPCSRVPCQGETCSLRSSSPAICGSACRRESLLDGQSTFTVSLRLSYLYLVDGHQLLVHVRD